MCQLQLRGLVLICLASCEHGHLLSTPVCDLKRFGGQPLVSTISWRMYNT